MYCCSRCGYKTDVFKDIKCHLKRKRPCPSALSDVSPNDILEKIIEERKPKGKYLCDLCGKVFSTSQSKYQHKKYHCNNLKELRLESQIQFLQEELKKSQEQNSIVNNIQSQTITNNIQQNIVINLKSFGCENMEYLPKDFLNSCLISNNIIPLIESIHFDKEHPENHNVKIKSLKHDFMQTYVDGNWIVTDKEETLDQLINKGYRVLKYHCRKNKDELLENNEVDEEELDDVNKWLENLYEDKKLRTPVKRQLLLLFINNKTMLLSKDF